METTNGGQLGLGKSVSVEKKFSLLMKGAKDVFCGKNFTLIWKRNGEVLVFGRNTSGELV